MSSAAEQGQKRKQRKEKYKNELLRCLEQYKNIIIVNVDNVGSSQMQKVRLALRGKGQLLMGKNTIIRKFVREQLTKNPKLESLLPYVYGNIGFVFTNTDLRQTRDLIVSNKVPAAAKSGSLAPNDVHIPAGPTGLDPGQTNFFQALNIATKIEKGAIAIINPVHLIRSGDKVTASHVALLTKLNILPFFFGFKVQDIYEDGVCYSSQVLDITPDQLQQKFLAGVSKIAAISLAIGYPTQASLPHLVSNAYKKLMAIAIEADIDIPQVKEFKDKLANASKAPAPAATAAAPAASTKKEPEPVKKEPEPAKDDDEGVTFDLFS
jgi:large subunit ribosomal protein LP0